MKTSKKILIVLAGIIIALLIFTLLILKRDALILLENMETLKYEEVPVEKFNQVELSGNWKVKIKQGNHPKLELAIDSTNGIIPTIDNSEGRLFLEVDSMVTTSKAYARITAPGIKHIKAKGNTHVELSMYWIDSLRVVLADSSIYTGNKNDIEFLSIERE